jgi:hypothetical protein
VGHAVEDDLRLTPALQSAIAKAIPPARLVHWLRWQRELFADRWACVACGESYVCALADYLSVSSSAAPAIAEGSKYPPAWLRIAANLHFLAQLEVPAANAALWSAAYPTVAADAVFIDDLPAYTPCLSTGTPPFAPGGVIKADRLANSWRSPLAQAPEDQSMRVAAAAFRLAYEAEPEGAWTAAAKKALNGAVVKGIRSGKNTAATDVARGESLVAMLLKEAFE